MESLRRLRQTVTLLVAIFGTVAGGTIGFHFALDESWFQALYRSIVTASLTGLL